MSHPASRNRALTVEEYLRAEETATVRHEYVGGEVHAMTGGTLRHNRIALNVTTRLHAAARRGPCQIFVNDVKVRAASDVIYYPDVVVSCAAQDDRGVIARDPCVVVEVLSPSTRTTDRREKLANYKRIRSLRAYLVVEQRERAVERHWRHEGGAWWREEVSDVTDASSVAVPCPDAVLTLDEIYEGVTLRPIRDRLRRVREATAAR
jgi:Uma2 family endonuclease